MSASNDVERTEDGRYLVVAGRRWRAVDPQLPDEEATSLRSALGRARSAVRRTQGDARRAARERVQWAKEGLGERGDAWWDLPVTERIHRAQQRLRLIGESERSAAEGKDAQGRRGGRPDERARG